MAQLTKPKEERWGHRFTPYRDPTPSSALKERMWWYHMLLMRMDSGQRAPTSLPPLALLHMPSLRSGLPKKLSPDNGPEATSSRSTTRTGDSTTSAGFKQPL